MISPCQDGDSVAGADQETLVGAGAQERLHRVVRLAVAAIPACDYAGVSLRHPSGLLETPAVSHPVVARAHTLQHALGEGPCLDPGWDDDTCLVADLTADERWPRWAPAAAELGVRSVLSLRLSTEPRLSGGLNLYSTTPAAFEHDDVLSGHVYAMHASSALTQSQETEELRVALATRYVTALAQGILMARLDVDAERAFEVLQQIALYRKAGLREVAAAVVDHRGRYDELPWISS